MDTSTGVFDAMHQVTELIDAFEDCSLPRTAWTHEAHLVVAAWYLSRYPECEATNRVITGIQRYNHAHGIRTTLTGGYHETLTLFWLSMVQRCLASVEPSAPLPERINAVLDAYGAIRDLVFEYYTRDRIMSLRARQTWVEPDRRPLESSIGERCDPPTSVKRTSASAPDASECRNGTEGTKDLRAVQSESTQATS